MRVILQSKTHESINTHKLVVIPPVAFNCKNIFLTSVAIPYTFYNIRNTNNQLFINHQEVRIPVQNYNSAQLASALTALLPDGGKCVFNTQKLKYIITNVGEPFFLRFTTSYKLFGFNQNTEAFSVGEYQESDFVGDINDGLHSLILTANFASPFSSLFNEDFGTQIIARIPIENIRGGTMINYSDPNNNRPIASNVKQLQYFEINVFDDDLKPLELNGVDYQIEMYIELENEITTDTLRAIKNDGEMINK